MTDLHKPGDILRPASPADAATLAQLSTELGYPATAARLRRRLAELTDKPGHLVLVACRGETVCGWIHAERRVLLETGEYAEITGLVVSAGARRSGIGKRLVEATERWAAQQGLAAIRVRSNVARTESHPFYRALGYEEMKTQRIYGKPL